MSKRFGVVFLLVAIIAAGCSSAPAVTPSPTVVPTPGAIAVNPPLEIVDFTLIGQDGEATTLSALRGKIVLMAFGYTHCPDVCPVTLARFKQVKDSLGEMSSDVAFVFVSVDGERDTPERLNEYLPMFDPSFIGLTGEQDNVRAVISQYGGDFNIKDAEGLRKNYTVDHTASSFLMDAEGRWVQTFEYNTAPSIIVETIEMVQNAAS